VRNLNERAPVTAAGAAAILRTSEAGAAEILRGLTTKGEAVDMGNGSYGTSGMAPVPKRIKPHKETLTTTTLAARIA